MSNNLTGRINSVQTLGTLDGPGVRFVVFMQGCPLRCACCHNPETWDTVGGTEYSATKLFKKVERYKEYFGSTGGVTVSGGEPLLQAEFVAEFFKICQENGIHTCLDTSGAVFNNSVKELLNYTDYCLLDIKYSNNEYYRKYVGCEIEKPLSFLKHLDEVNVPTRIRQVIIKGKNDAKGDMLKLREIVAPFKCVAGIELLPFRTLCRTKYDKLGLEFKFKEIKDTSEAEIKNLEKILKSAN